jgi:pyruvate dehydrogenase E2 component (dihydrolipoamide acetyltransferase)
MSQIEVKVPDIGDFAEVEVIELMVKVGDTIKVDQSLLTVESDKASMEIPSSQAGVIKEIKIKVGDKVKEGSVIVVMEADGAAAAPAAAAPAAPAAAAPAPTPAPAAAAPATAQAAPAAGGSQVVSVPDIGDFDEVEVIEIMVKAGDTVKVDQSLLTVESDKASMEIPSSHAGVVKEVKVKVGDKVAKGTQIVVLDAVAGSAPAAAPAPSAPAAAAPAAPAPAPAAASAAPATPAAPAPVVSGGGAHASPSVRKFARELGVDLTRVGGSGPKGRILHEDVQSYVKAALAGNAGNASKAAAGGGGAGSGLNLLPWPSLDFSKFGATALEPLSRIKKLSGPNLHRNWVMIPHVTQYDEADVTELEEFRKTSNDALAKAKSSVKLTMLAFVIKACVAALKKYPAFNSSLDATGENLILKQYYHIGFAADTPNGLVVPVVKDADKKTISQIAQDMADLSLQAREGKLKPTDMQGASFTISSLGGIGGTLFTPIINAPEVAILGLSKTAFKPVWDGKQFVPRLILPLSLSYDHRVIDGAMGARFSTYVSEVLADLRKTLL